MSDYLFVLGQKVKILASGESGKITGRAEYMNSENNYFVCDKDGNGDWLAESALIKDGQY